jgi:hypothetical protein
MGEKYESGPATRSHGVPIKAVNRSTGKTSEKHTRRINVNSAMSKSFEDSVTKGAISMKNLKEIGDKKGSTRGSSSRISDERVKRAARHTYKSMHDYPRKK